MSDDGVEYFDHDADIGLRVRGATIEEAFARTARAMFDVMLDTSGVAPRENIEFDFVENDRELALVTWLNRLLAEARARGLALGRFQIQRQGARWLGKAHGEPWRAELERGTEVKGATLTMLKVRETESGFEVSCVVDV